MEEHRSWEWVRKRYVPAPIVEKQLKNGESVTLTMGPTVVDLRDGTEFPEGVTRLLVIAEQELSSDGLRAESRRIDRQPEFRSSWKLP
jgi:hypothetical protein